MRKPIPSKDNLKAIRKTYTVTKTELHLIEKIKDHLLNQKCVVTDSQVIRMGLLALSSLSESQLTALAEKVPTLLKKSKI